MRPLQIALTVIAGCIITSCVSNKKYNEALSSRQMWKDKYDNMESSYNELRQERDQLYATSTATLENKERLLSDKDAALQTENRKLQEMKDLVNAQRDAIRNLKKEVCSALKCFTPDELTIEVREGKLYVSLSDKLLFPSGSDAVNARGKEAISMLAAVLATNSDLEIMIEGHTDPVPINSDRNKDNWDLSVHRATSVSRLFIEDGILPERVIASGRAYYHPLASNETSTGRQQNRRTEIVLSPKLDKLWKLTEQDGDLKLSEVKE